MIDHYQVKNAFVEFHRVCKELENYLPKLRESLQELKDQNKRDMLVLRYGQPVYRNKIFDRIIKNQNQIKKLMDQLYILESLEGFPAAHLHFIDEIGIISGGVKNRIQDTIKMRTKEEELVLQYMREEQR